jgi:adenosylcobinamide-GDP ribazoletransferase
MSEETSRSTFGRGSLNAFLTAIQFLLVSPAFIKRPFTPQELGAAVGFYPLAGLILGAGLLGVDALFGLFLPLLLRSALVLALWVLLTGALHLDGLLDAFDGLFGGFDAEQRMQIMRDERIGAYALASGTLLLLVKFSALASLSERLPALLLAPVLGRTAMALALVAFPYARPQGLGRDVKDHATHNQAIMATAFALAIAGGLAILGNATHILAALLAAALVAFLVVRFTLKRIPGLTGDIYGAVAELVEASVLIVMAFR